MKRVILDNVCVDFPIFTAQSRGLLNTVASRLGVDTRISRMGRTGLQVRALDRLTLTIEDGDRLAIIGRNGAGKSTLLRVLSKVYEPTFGSIHIAGVVSSLTDLALGVDPEATGYEFIRARSLILNLQDVDKLIADVELFSELGDHLYLPVSSYSSGMSLRLAFAVATAFAPDILIMDEMIGVGDAGFFSKATKRLNNIIIDSKVLVLASHNESVLREFCNKAIFLESGKIICSGSVEECLESYAAFTDSRSS